MHPILNVVVVGFHHKKGSQVEYCYPPLRENVVPDPDKDIPEQWTSLPSLAIPDGAHNVKEDVIYFILPSTEKANHAVFGISCYRQIATEELTSKDKEITRSAVQKSVCVLSTIPLFGVLKNKLELITQTYFNEKDFSKFDVLRQMYTNLCDLFDMESMDTYSAYMGISLAPLLDIFKHRTLLLFKLLLLERKVMFHIFPVNLLGEVMIGLASLFPKLVDEGLFEAAAYSVRRFPIDADTAVVEDVATEVDDVQLNFDEKATQRSSKTLLNNVEETLNKIIIGEDASNEETIEEATAVHEDSAKLNPSSFKTDEYGFPLSIFTKGSLFHPYISISYLDMINSDNTRAYCIGVTNALFKTRKDMVDVIVTVDEKGDGQIEILSAELKRQLTLTTQDLRFTDFLLRMKDMNIDPALWEGSDDWVRSQFYIYILALLAVAKSDNTEAASEFNDEFINAWKTKHNYRVWSCTEHPGMGDIQATHPFSGQLNVNDVLLRMGNSLNSSEQGKKMISTISNTGRYVAETGSRFKSSISSWVRNTTSRFQDNQKNENSKS
uniref:UDENN domain-containing protein n=2 Tax=Panagrolaimus sp. JU765 TaxID=591449 RepID=A0AC34RJ36_9BILA